jgi:dTDP-4-dehydrorhamnose 3,5-epimerase-like enzyme
MNPKKVIIPTISDPNGSLSFIESNILLPFRIKRIYYIYNVINGSTRGFHAHYKLQQFLFCPFGEIEIITDNSRKRNIFILNKPNEGLIIGPGIWREIIWKKDNSILVVAASLNYNEKDYIRNYNEFLKFKGRKSIGVKL